MKYVIVHGSGLLEPPQPQANGKTPLHAASTPHLDLLATHGTGGMLTIPAEGASVHSDLVHLAVLGYDAQKYYPGPGPFEAAGLGVVLDEADVAYICSMVTLKSGARDSLKKLAPHVVMEGPVADVETEQARELIDAINEQLGSETIQFYPGRGERHVMVWVGGKARATCLPPNDAAGKPIGESLPRGDGSEVLRQLMDASLVILRDHPVNEERREGGLKPANCLWLWGQGRWPKVSTLADRYQITGTIVSQSDLHKGVGICAGLDALETSTDTVAAVDGALGELEKKPFVYLHVPLPADLADGTDPKAKLECIEVFDRETVGRLLKGIEKLGPHRVLAVCDSTRTFGPPAASASVLYALYEGPSAKQPTQTRRFAELGAASTPARVRDAAKLFAQLVKKSGTTGVQ